MTLIFIPLPRPGAYASTAAREKNSVGERRFSSIVTSGMPAKRAR
jgi:hypothetical protein